MRPPRFPLGVFPTPLVRAHRLEQALGCGPVLIKRDDLIGFGVAGNKTRALEYLLGAAVQDGHDTVVTGGSAGSNFVHGAATAAATAGLECELVIAGKTPLPASPGLALATAVGARIVATGDDRRESVDDAIESRAEVLRTQGRHPMAVPRGGSTPLGALGYADAVAEVAKQLDDIGLSPTLVVVALGSGGTTAGLLAGLSLHGLAWPVLAVSVSRPVDQIRTRVLDIADGCASLVGASPVRPDLLEVIDARPPKYGGEVEAVDDATHLGLRTEGLLLDRPYSARSFAATVDRLRSGQAGPVMFWHTGGLLTALMDLTIAGAA